MKYPVIIHQEGDSAYGVTIPDIPGCFSAGDTFDEALANTLEAIEGHLGILAEDGDSIPTASSMAEFLKSTQVENDGIVGFVDVDVTPFLGKGQKINVTLPIYVIHKIEKAGIKNRSAFLAEAALKELAS